MQAMSATFATIASRMRINLFAQSSTPNPDQSSTVPQPPVLAAPSQPRTGRTFPADEIVWGIVIRSGFDEMDDPWYHRGTTQHAYLEGNDNVAICGFRPPQSGPRTRRRSRLGLPTTGEHPMCGMCARMVVAPRPRVPVLVQPVRPAVAVPVTGGAAQPVPAASTRPVNVPPRAVKAKAPASIPVAMSQPQAASASTSPWVRRATGEMEPRQGTATTLTGSHDNGLLARVIHSETEI
jgi:hypothetical protein